MSDPNGTPSAVWTTNAWRAANEAGDATAAVECLAADVELISPLTAQFRSEAALRSARSWPRRTR